LSKTRQDAGTMLGQYNTQRRRQRRRDSRDAVLSDILTSTLASILFTTIQAGTTLQHRWSRNNRQPSVQHQILFRTICLSEDAL